MLSLVLLTLTKSELAHRMLIIGYCPATGIVNYQEHAGINYTHSRMVIAQRKKMKLTQK